MSQGAPAACPDLTRYIRDIPDFPKPGILFKDITPLLSDASAFDATILGMARPYAGQVVDQVVGIESRGFIFGAALARELGAGFTPVRKKGKLPWNTYEATYELEYGSDTIAVHKDGVAQGARVIVVDDLLATGGTMSACLKLVDQLGATIVGVSFVIILEFLRGRDRLGSHPIHTLLTF